MPNAPTRIIALGLSAGGYYAAGDFLDHIALNTHLAFVIVDHKDSGSEYSLQAYFQAHTDMPVVEIVDGLRPQADTVYISTSTQDPLLVDGVFRIRARDGETVRGNIDAFFSSLAASEGAAAVGIVLSGMLEDGTEGLKQIRRHGGTAIVQDPESALYDSMPRSAIRAGVEDFVLTPRQMAELVLKQFAESEPGMPTFHPRSDNLIKFFGNLDRLLQDLNRPILVLDDDLRIKGFGGAIQEFLPVVDTDVGRRVTDLQPIVNYATLAADVEQVFRRLGHKEIPVTGADGKRFLLRLSSGDYAPALKPVCIVSLIPLDGIAGNHAQNHQITKPVAKYGIVMAHVDAQLRYTWILNPHPDFRAADIIGKTDTEIADNSGTRELQALKRRVLTGGGAEERAIQFPLSDGLISYRISAHAIRGAKGETIGVSTVGVEFGERP